jgi:hypothetical protein
MATLLTSTNPADYMPKELATLRKEVEQLPRSVRDRLLPLCDKICRFIHLQGRLFEIAQENCDRMQLDLKCLLFDLDCTRQERDDLREHWENPKEGWEG